jgi:hypothetical protein
MPVLQSALRRSGAAHGVETPGRIGEAMSNKLTLVPIFQDEAFAFIDRFHRHHRKPRGSLFQIAAEFEGEIVGVCVVGRPVARSQQDGFTVEVTRLCTDGTANACSFLYSAAWRVARELGYRRLITYILNTEPGTSLRAAGWVCLGERRGQSWNVPSRPRIDKHPLQNKILFEKV